jgi:hypothetical protein
LEHHAMVRPSIMPLAIASKNNGSTRRYSMRVR